MSGFGHIYHLAMATPSVVNAGTQTLIQLRTPSSRRAWIKSLAVSGKDTDGTKVPALVDVIRQTSDGTGGTAITPRVLRVGLPVALCSAVERPTAEPTDSGVVVAGPWYVTTVGGLFLLQVPLGDEIEMDVSTRLGLRLTTVGTITGVLANMDYME